MWTRDYYYVHEPDIVPVLLLSQQKKQKKPQSDRWDNNNNIRVLRVTSTRAFLDDVTTIPHKGTECLYGSSHLLVRPKARAKNPLHSFE